MLTEPHYSGAGAETAAATMSWWTLAMLVHPEVQKRAQKELDAVIGHDRVPTFADKPRLPYVVAIVKEVLRWRPVTPIGVCVAIVMMNPNTTADDLPFRPHRTTEDDIYQSYFIPKGTLVIPNVWELNQDSDLFGADAHSFNPARYLDETGQLTTGPPGTKDDGHFSYGVFSNFLRDRRVAEYG